MRKQAIHHRLLSALLMFALVLSMLSIFVSASDDEQSVAVTDEVYFNRSFADGWDYSNGFSSKLADNSARIVRRDYVDGEREYLLSLKKENTDRGYIALDTEGLLPESGKVYLEMTYVFEEGSDFGTVCSIEFKNGLIGSRIIKLVEVVDGEIYVLDSYIGDCDGERLALSFCFDFDYAPAENK